MWQPIFLSSYWIKTIDRERRRERIKRNVIWTTLSCDNLFDNQIIQINLSSDTKIKAIEREKVKWQCEYERESCHKSCQKIVVQISFLKNKTTYEYERVVSKVVKKWLYKYHFSICKVRVQTPTAKS